MSRILYALCVIGLLGGSGWAASGLKDRPGSEGRIGVVLLAALQR